MSESFLIYPGEPADALIRWHRGDGAEGAAETIADLAAAAPLGQPATLIAPGELAPARAVQAPAGATRQARAAAGFALEDDLAQDLDALHVALGPSAGDGRRAVAMIDRDRLGGWLADAEAAGLEISRVVPDHRLIEDEADAVHVLFDEARAVVRCGATGFACEWDLATAIAAQLAAEEGRERLVLIGAPADLDPGVEGLEVVRLARAPGRSTLAALAEGLADADLDLRQGAFAPKTPWGRILAPWRPAAAMAAAAALFFVAGAVADIVRYDAAADANRDRAEAVFADAFPGVRRVGDISGQSRRQAARVAGGGGSLFLSVSEAFAAVSETLDGARLSSIRFSDRDGSGEASVELQYPAFEDIETIRRVLGERGFVLEESSTRQQQGAIVSTLIVRPR